MTLGYGNTGTCKGALVEASLCEKLKCFTNGYIVGKDIVEGNENGV